MKNKAFILLALLTSMLFLLISCDESVWHTHTFGEWQTVVEPSCTQDGEQYRICTDCTYEERSKIKTLQHNTKSAVTLPTCESQGYTTYTCECGYSYTADFIAPLGHILNGETTEPTCELQGYTHYVCEVCDYEFDTDYTEPLAHKNSESLLFYPTVMQSGYTLYTCTDCGHSYKDDFIDYNEIMPHAHTENTEILKKGIDVSHWNHQSDSNGNYLPLDWEAIKQTGVEYVIIRAAYTGTKDPTFEMNYEGAKAAGLEVGAYFYAYSTTINGTIEDANALLEYLEGKQFEYPIYFDLEDPSLYNLEKEHLTRICMTFAEVLQSHGYYCGLYVNNDWLTNKLDTNTVKSNFDIWYSRYPLEPIEVPDDYYIAWDMEALDWNTEKYGKQLGMWQYTRHGKIDGFDYCYFDFSYSYKDFPSIMKQWKLNGF